MQKNLFLFQFLGFQLTHFVVLYKAKRSSIDVEILVEMIRGNNKYHGLKKCNICKSNYKSIYNGNKI